MEGFLSLEQAAEQLDSSVPELTQQIDDGQIVAIMRNGVPWLSSGEVSRVRRSLEKDSEEGSPAPLEVALPLPDLPPPSEPKPAPASEAAEPEEKPEPAPARAPRSESEASDLADLLARNKELARSNEDLERTLSRLKSGLQETEATLKRARQAKSNLEDDVIRLQEQLKTSSSRVEGLEREVQSLSSELERAEEARGSDFRRGRSKDRQPQDDSFMTAGELDYMRKQMAEKDRLIAEEYEERAVLRSQLETNQQKYYELKAVYDKEKAEWSEILAREIQYQSQLKQQLEELRPKSNKGWNPFRREK